MVQLRPTFASSKPSTNPYVGPRAFGHGDKLYGRDRELLELSDLLVAERIVVLHSPSGAGKTSLIQAEDGLLRVLKRQRFSPLPPVRVNLQPLGKPAVAGRYAYSIMESLESARGTKRQMTSEQLAGMSLAQYLKDAYQTSGDGGTSEPLVLILDQFEEVFTLDPTDVDGRIQFFSDLGDLGLIGHDVKSGQQFPHDRRHQEMRGRQQRGLHPDDVHELPFDTDFLAGFPDGCSHWVWIRGLDAPPRKADLTRMVVQVRRAPREQYPQALISLDQGHQDRCLARLRVGRTPGKEGLGKQRIDLPVDGVRKGLPDVIQLQTLGR